MSEKSESPYIERYLDAKSDIVLAPSTVETYRRYLNQYAEFLSENNTTIMDANQGAVVRFIESAVSNGNRKSTLKTKLTVIKQLYRYLKLRTDQEDQLQVDPIELETINLDKYRTPEPIEREALSRSELRRLFDAMSSRRNRQIALTGAETGLRNSDLRNLLISDVDFDELTIHVRNPKNDKPYSVPITSELGFELKQWLHHHRPAYQAADSSDYVFPSKHGEQIETNGGLNRIIREAANEAGIQDTIGESTLNGEQQNQATGTVTREWHRVTVHTLRHTFITLLNDSGVSLPYRQLVANHSSTKTTQRYTHKGERFDKIRSSFTSVVSTNHSND